MDIDEATADAGRGADPDWCPRARGGGPVSAQLESAGRELLRRASQCGGEARALAVRLELPAAEGAALRLFESAAEEDRFYWEQPSQGRAVCGLGALRRLEAAGASALVQVAAASQSLFDAVEVVGAPAPRAAGPLLLGGFAFDVLAERADASPWRGFAPVSFVLPEAVYVREGPRAWLCVLAWLPAGHSPEQRVALTQRAPDELAAVIAHEMSHVILRHSIQRVWSQLAIKTVSLATPATRSIAPWVRKIGIQWFESAYSREKEFEADELGLTLAEEAGYDPLGSGRILERLLDDCVSTITQTGRATFPLDA